MKIFCLLLAPLFFTSCSPLRSSPSDGQHIFELSLHEVQTNLDDLRHDIHCFQTELQILEGRILSHENALATLGLDKQQERIDQLATQLQVLEKHLEAEEKGKSKAGAEVKQLTSHANETTAALSQFKERILEIEHELLEQNRRFEELGKVKGNLEALVKTLKGVPDSKLYRVSQGDTLEKIARNHETTVEKLKQLNKLENDFIAIGQQLKIPTKE